MVINTHNTRRTLTFLTKRFHLFLTIADVDIANYIDGNKLHVCSPGLQVNKTTECMRRLSEWFKNKFLKSKIICYLLTSCKISQQMVKNNNKKLINISMILQQGLSLGNQGAKKN